MESVAKSATIGRPIVCEGCGPFGANPEGFDILQTGMSMSDQISRPIEVLQEGKVVPSVHEEDPS